MNCTNIKSGNNDLVKNQNRDQFPWLSLDSFKAKTTTSDKVNRIVNDLLFAAGVYGVYALITGETGWGACACYASIALASRKLVSTMIGYSVYPAASPVFSFTKSCEPQEHAKKETKGLEAEGFIVKNIAIYKSGTKYDAIIVTHPKIMKKRAWAINALGNKMMVEFSIARFAKENFSNQCSTLLINGPSVNQSSGWPTRYQMGAGFEAGIRFLEKEARATHIIMRGFSLGGGMIAEAILNHDFTKGMKQNIHYLCIIDRSFAYLSTVAGALIGEIVEGVFYVTGTELDGVAAARKLSDLRIKQIIIQHTSENGQASDYVIPDNVSLSYELHKHSYLENKIFLESTEIYHNGPLPKNINDSLNCEINKFIEV